MLYLRTVLVTILIAAFYSNAFGIVSSSDETTPNKVFVVDGHVVHNMGQLSSNVTNWGLIGSMPSVSKDFRDSPSAMWPAGSGNEYLWGACLWVGGQILGESFVSTGFSASEIHPSTSAGDTIFSATADTPGGTRFPWQGADDDGDGQDDEDPLDGIDNDGDGWIDEDFAAIGDQGYYCSMADNYISTIENNPDHRPLNIQVTQQSYQWNDTEAEDFIGYQYTMKNIGVTEIRQFCCGIYSDFDIGPRGVPGAHDDLAGSFVGQVHVSDGSFVDVSIGYMRDNAETNPLPGWAGWVMCGMETDAPGGLDLDPMLLPTIQIMTNSLPFEDGGDPSNDTERFELLTANDWDPNIPSTSPGDYRLVISPQVLPVLGPDDSVTFRVALVLGDGLQDLLINAAEAVLTAQGKNYDRDGDPANGAEFNVPWMRPDDGPPLAVPGVAPLAVLYEAVPNPFNPQTTIAFDLLKETTVSVRVFDMSGRLVNVLLDNEAAVEGRNEVFWGGCDLSGRSVSTGVYFYRLDTDSFSETKRMTLVK